MLYLTRGEIGKALWNVGEASNISAVLTHAHSCVHNYGLLMREMLLDQRSFCSVDRLCRAMLDFCRQ